MTPKQLRIERIHDLWRKARRTAEAAIKAFLDAVDDDAPPAERRRLSQRARHLCKRAHTLAMAEVRAELGDKQGG